MYHPKVAKLIKKDSPKSKLILIVCDPVKRAFSKWKEDHLDVKISNTTRFSQYFTLPNGSLNTKSFYIRFSHYAERVKPWLSTFPRNKILIINGENVRKNPYPEILKAEKYLGLPKLVKKQTFSKMVGRKFPCWKTYKGKKCFISQIKGRKHPETKGEVKLLVDKLREYFIPRNEEFFKLTGVKFNWSMDEA